MGSRVLRISPPILMIQISGSCRNVAKACPYNLTESDFSKFCLFISGDGLSQKIPKITDTLIGKNFVFSGSKSKMKNPALLSC